MFGSVVLPVGLGLLLIALALFLLWFNERRTRRQRLITEHHRALGLPEGKLVYEDADGKGDLLTSDDYPLVGKPDYIVQAPDGRPVPIELKLNVQEAPQPYSNHIIQIGAYCLLLEDYFEQPPLHGILRYADREFTVDYTPALRKKVIRLLTEMAQYDHQKRPPLAKQKASKCRACAFQPICPVGRNK